MPAICVPGRAADHAAARLINVTDVLQLTSVSRGTLYLMMKAGEFPRPLQIGKRRVAWREAQVREWIESRQAVRWAA